MDQAVPQFEPLLNKFSNIVSKGRLSHAYLVVGDNLTLLEQFVQELMKICVCSQHTHEGKACGCCAECRSVDDKTYPYLYELKPQSKLRQIRIPQVREFETNFQIKAPKGKLRIGIIWESDRLNVNAANGFLKTLEEPMPGSLLILVSVRPNAMLPTIRSRCQVLPLRTTSNYEFEQRDDLLACLATLKPGGGSEAALAGANVISQSLAAIRVQAEDAIEPSPKAIEETATQKKERLATDNARIESEYLSRRETFLSVIHTWFSQLVLFSNGVDKAHLPYSYFLDAPGTEWVGSISKGDAEYLLKCADEFLVNLRFNVKEALVLDDFLLKLCRKR